MCTAARVFPPGDLPPSWTFLPGHLRMRDVRDGISQLFQQPLCARHIMNRIKRPLVGFAFAVALKLSRITCTARVPVANQTMNRTLAPCVHTTYQGLRVGSVQASMDFRLSRRPLSQGSGSTPQRPHCGGTKRLDPMSGVARRDSSSCRRSRRSCTRRYAVVCQASRSKSTASRCTHPAARSCRWPP